MERNRPGIPLRNSIEYNNGIRTETMEDIDWYAIREHRDAWLKFTDIYALSDINSGLTEEQKAEITVFRQQLRDATDYGTANEACDNFPQPPEWLED